MQAAPASALARPIAEVDREEDSLVPGDDIKIAVRSLHDLKRARVCEGRRGGSREITPDGLSAAEDVLKNLVADVARRGGDDDHIILLLHSYSVSQPHPQSC